MKSFALGLALVLVVPSFSWGDTPDGIIIIPIATFTPTVTPVPTSTPQRDFDKNGIVDSRDLYNFIMGWHQETAGHKITITIPDIISTARPLTLVRVPRGTFQMGTPGGEAGRDSGEGPLHIVTIQKDFYLGETEVTQAQWEAITGKTIGDQRNLTNPIFDVYTIGKDYPIYYLSWDDSLEFIGGLNALGQGTFRFPSEAEWEYACRAGTISRFSFGNSLNCGGGCEDCVAEYLLGGKRSDYMWYCSTDGGDSFRGPKLAASLLPNAFGLYDMHGNVWEFCQDLYHFGYNGAPVDGRAWDDAGVNQRIFRSGSSFDHADECRSGYRNALSPSMRHSKAGLRVAMDAPD